MYGFVTAVELSALHVAERHSCHGHPVLGVLRAPGSSNSRRRCRTARGAVRNDAIYRPRAQRGGSLGPARRAAEPHVQIDAPDDQGGYVHATWTKSPPRHAAVRGREQGTASGASADAFTRAGAGDARACCAKATTCPTAACRLLQLTSANGSSEYFPGEYVGGCSPTVARRTRRASRPGESDSVPGANPATRFMIEGPPRRRHAVVVLRSDVGSSADNLAPESPASFFRSGHQVTELHWPKSLEADSRSTGSTRGRPNFTPSASNPWRR